MNNLSHLGNPGSRVAFGPAHKLARLLSVADAAVLVRLTAGPSSLFSPISHSLPL